MCEWSIDIASVDVGEHSTIVWGKLQYSRGPTLLLNHTHPYLVIWFRLIFEYVHMSFASHSQWQNFCLELSDYSLSCTPNSKGRVRPLGSSMPRHTNRVIEARGGPAKYSELMQEFLKTDLLALIDQIHDYRTKVLSPASHIAAGSSHVILWYLTLIINNHAKLHGLWSNEWAFW